MTYDIQFCDMIKLDIYLPHAVFMFVINLTFLFFIFYFFVFT